MKNAGLWEDIEKISWDKPWMLMIYYDILLVKMMIYHQYPIEKSIKLVDLPLGNLTWQWRTPEGSYGGL